MELHTNFTRQLGTKLPIIMAPMFLVSNQEMMISGMKAGLMATFPSLNYRKTEDLGKALDACNEFMKSPDNNGSYGVNLIVQETNVWYRKHLDLCIEKKVPLFITSLGNPAEVIKRAHEYGGKVLCDITNLKHAEKVVKQGCDGLIAVGQGAGGHGGPTSLLVMLPVLKEKYPDLLIIGAGGIASGSGLASVLLSGGDGVSVGTRFIASPEAGVGIEYKEAIVNYGMDDVVLTDKISGTPCNVINTPYVKKIGTKQNFIERFLNKNRATKKIFKSLVQLRGMKRLETAALGATYKTMWCAGQTIGLIDEILSTEEIVRRMVKEYEESVKLLPSVTKELEKA